MDMIKRKASVRISRYSSNAPPYAGVSIIIQDESGGATVEADMSLQDFRERAPDRR